MAEQKETKAKVRYRTGHFATRCGNCTMFRPPAGCTAVLGVISPQGLCDLFKRKDPAVSKKAAA